MSLSLMGDLSPSLSFSLSSSFFVFVPTDGEGVLEVVTSVCVCPFWSYNLVICSSSVIEIDDQMGWRICLSDTNMNEF